MATTLASQVQELYVGYLGRAADKAGLDFWVKAIENGTSTLESVALGFTLSEEYKAQYNGLTTTQLVAKVYQNVLGRAADADGLAFWAGEVNKGVIKADTLVKSMINSLGAIDQLTIDNKVTAANAYTIAAGANYNVEAGKAAVLNAGATLPGANNPGQTFTLTTAAGEKVVGTSGNDEIRGVFGNATGTNNTLNIGDVIDGGAGTDTLILTSDGTTAVPAGVEIKGVEIVKLNVAGKGADAGFLTSALYTGVTQLWQVDGQAADTLVTASASANVAAGATADITIAVGSQASDYGTVTVADGVTAGFQGSGQIGAQAVYGSAAAKTVTVNVSNAGAATADLTATAAAEGSDLQVKAAAATQKVISIALDGVGDNSKLAVVAATGGKIETVNVSGTVAKESSSADGDLSIALTADTKTFTGSFTSGVDLTLGGTITAVETIDLSKSTGAIDLVTATGGFTALKTLTLGSGNDTATVNVSAKVDVVVDAGAGNDVITLASGSVTTDAQKLTTITLGAGNDTIKFSSVINNIADASKAEFEKGLVKVTDFKVGEDTLNVRDGISSAAYKAIGTTELGNIAAAADLEAAVKAAAGQAGINKTVVFGYGNNTYVLSNDGDAAFDAGDGLVELTGVKVGDLLASATSFISA